MRRPRMACRATIDDLDKARLNPGTLRRWLPARVRMAGGLREFVLSAALAAAAGAGWALEPTTPLSDYGRQAWGMENGLPQNSVHGVVQTNDGFLWAGTEAGLVRFDGNSFAVFDTNS